MAEIEPTALDLSSQSVAFDISAFIISDAESINRSEFKTFENIRIFSFLSSNLCYSIMKETCFQLNRSPHGYEILKVRLLKLVHRRS